jgi:hypothetical protein
LLDPGAERVRRFYDIAFTPSVKAEQERRGSRSHYAGDSSTNEILAAREDEFIVARDGFYLSTVNEDGWPYVQFRGGPPGFVRHVGNNVLRFPDFRGNHQYLSVGNAAAEQRCCIFLMDYADRRRLKIFGLLEFADVVDAPHVRAELGIEGYKAVLERVASVRVMAFDWNCAQHIPRRLTEEPSARIGAD